MWSRLTSRAVVLLLVAAALVMSLAFPLREFLAQRAQIGALTQELAYRQDQVTDMRAEQLRWNDADFVEMQARERLHYVFPGETGLILLSPYDAQQARAPLPPTESAPTVAWYDTLWTSVAAADDAR